MNSITNTAAEALPRWDFSFFYGERGDTIEQRVRDPQIASDIEEARARAASLSDKYKGRDLLRTLDGNALAAAIAEYEKFDELVTKIGFFFHLATTTHQKNTAVKAMAETANDTLARIKSDAVFFTGEIQRLDADELRAKLADSAALRHYEPWLNKQRALGSHRLSDEREAELQATEVERYEKYLTEFGTRRSLLAYPMPNRLLSQAHRDKYKVTDTRGETNLTDSEINGYILGSPLAETRKAAFMSSMQVLGAHGAEFAALFNRLLQEKAREDRERGFATPLAARNLANEVEDDVIDSLVKTVRAEYPATAQRYYRLKARLLGKDKLDAWDVLAPIPSASHRSISWEEAKTTVLRELQAFSPKMADAARQYFDNGWIDAEPRDGKSAGAFCASPCVTAPPALQMNFQHNPKDLVTLSHEIGHGINMLLAKKHGQLMGDADKAPITLAEVPSTFVEEIVFQALLRRAASDDEKIALLVDKIDRLSAAVMRQMAFHLFETAMHDAARKGETLTAESLGKMWKAALHEHYGTSVRVPEAAKSEWPRITTFLKTPFYVHAYAFAGLVTARIQDQINKGKVDNVAEKIEAFYTDLPVKHHSELLAPFGLDARAPDFWKKGLGVYKSYLDELEALMDKKRTREENSPQGHWQRMARNGYGTPVTVETPPSAGR